MQPSSPKRDATYDFPLPMPPTMPMMGLFWNTNVLAQSFLESGKSCRKICVFCLLSRLACEARRVPSTSQIRQDLSDLNSRPACGAAKQLIRPTLYPIARDSTISTLFPAGSVNHSDSCPSVRVFSYVYSISRASSFSRVSASDCTSIVTRR
jgi:hypothetical protein